MILTAIVGNTVIMFDGIDGSMRATACLSLLDLVGHFNYLRSESIHSGEISHTGDAG